MIKCKRTQAFVNKRKVYIKSFGEAGRKIILDLLEKYRIDGIDTVSDSNVFNISPFDKMGHVIGVA